MDKNLQELLELIEKDDVIYKIFRQCPYEILREVRIRHYGSREFCLDQGAIIDVFHIIIEGKADIYVDSERGKRYTITTYKKGDYIGEFEIFRQIPYISGVESREPISVLEIDRDVLLKWVQLDKNFSEYMIYTLCDTCYEMCKNMGESTLYPLKQKICQYFIANSDEKGNFRSPVYTRMLGAQMAVTQRSANRIVKQLKDKGIINIVRGEVVIEDYEALLREKDIK